MRTITVGQFVSLDGVVESPEKWHMPYVDEEMMQAIWSEPADTLLLGRVTYDSFAGAFAALPDDDPIGGPMNRPAKVVVSRTRPSLAWRNSRLLPEGDLTSRVAELKAGPGGPISVVGSISVVRALLAAGLVDRLSLLVHPLVVGVGQRLFPAEGPQLRLTLEKCDVLRSGVTHHLYTVD
ncbi:dihydrofolate reductase family protein [Asanoa sp. NPDC049518]|uniref:dihydrofolate reductase family protein n=1 Tax=unclassified Asanoa TaxID=2685164 RepID=UPI003425F73F